MLIRFQIPSFACIFAMTISSSALAADDQWMDTVINKIEERQYQETINDPFVSQSPTAPSFDCKFILSCAFDLYERKGLFEAAIGGYTRSDNPVDTLFNEIAQIPDADIFVTLTSLIYLIDGGRYTQKDIANLVTPAVAAIGSFHDKNHPSASVLGFWEQKLINNTWIAYTANAIKLGEDANAVEVVLRDACEAFFSAAECQAHFPGLPGAGGESNFVPSDTDDTSENLSVGALLALNQNDPAYGPAFQMWMANNPPAKIKAALAKIMQYAYSGGGSSVANNLIDPRTYYFLSGFYETLPTSARLPVTWLLNNEEVLENHYNGREEWPTPHLALYNVNDIDPIEVGHFITAVARLDRSGLLAQAAAGDMVFVNALEQIVYDATRYLIYLVSIDAAYSRPDILANYYAYPEQLYEVLGNFAAVTSGYVSQLPQLHAAGIAASAVMEGSGTSQLINHFEVDPEKPDEIYWEGVLKNKETTGGYYVRDRVYATATAVSALLDSLTHEVTPGHPEWKPSVNVAITDVIVPNAISFLKRQTLERTPSSIAFVGTTTYQSNEIYRYPANNYAYLDGEPLASKDCVVNKCPTETYGVLGHIPRTEYVTLLAQGPFDFGPTPTQASAWGTSGASAYIWRSEPQAYALVLKVVAQFEKIGDGL